MSERFVKMSDATGDVLPKASTTANFTLRGGSTYWTIPSGKTYYEQTVTSDDYPELAMVTSTINGVMGLSRTVTDAQFEAAADAQLRCIDQGTGTITVSAKSMPEIDIPCILILLG